MRIIINGLESTEQTLARLQTQLGPESERATRKAVLYVQGEVPDYPPAPPGSTYSRTGTLGRSVTSLAGQAPGALSRVERAGGHTVGIIGTAIKYAQYVIDEERQAWMHEGRWWTLQDVVRNARDGIVAIYRDMVRRLMRS
ncbi:MAG TPA: hypothetical protein PLD57_12680 [Aggregatilineales bacterium]|nr:hypothetical protein [Aggregatilineales bacterium]